MAMGCPVQGLKSPWAVGFSTFSLAYGVHNNWGSLMVNLYFPYAKLSADLQRLVNDQLDMMARRQMRSICKLFSKFAAGPLLLGGRWPSLILTVNTLKPDVPREAGIELLMYDVIGRPTELLLYIHAVDGGATALWPDFLFRFYGQADDGDAPTERELEFKFEADLANQLRFTDKLLSHFRCAEVHVDARFPLKPPGWLTRLLSARRPAHLVARTQFGPRTFGHFRKERYLRLDAWLPADLVPDVAFVIGGGPRPECYLDVQMDAFNKLINCPVIYLQQRYNRETSAIRSLRFTKQLFEHIIKAPRPETADGRRLVIIDTNILQIEEEEIPGGGRLIKSPPLPNLQIEYERMLEEVAKMMDDTIEGNDIQVYRIDLSLRLRTPQICQGWPIYDSTFANLVVAQNYASRHQVYAHLRYIDRREVRSDVDNFRRVWPREIADYATVRPHQ